MHRPPSSPTLGIPTHQPHLPTGHPAILFGARRNNAIASGLGKDPTPDQCKLQYFHKSGGGQEPGGYHTGVYTAPSPEGDDFTECHPWKESSCCHSEVVMTPKAINEAYGEGYHWDRCDGFVDGYTMSDACQRFFVQEACMYECDPHSGEYRRYTDAEADAYEAFKAIDGNPGDYAGLPADDPLYQGTFEHNGVTYNKILFRGNGVYGPNKWQMYQMPIKASYCDAFLTACANDYFCGDGDFWACSADWKVREPRWSPMATMAPLCLVVSSSKKPVPCLSGPASLEKHAPLSLAGAAKRAVQSSPSLHAPSHSHPHPRSDPDPDLPLGRCG